MRIEHMTSLIIRSIFKALGNILELYYISLGMVGILWRKWVAQFENP